MTPVATALTWIDCKVTGSEVARFTPAASRVLAYKSVVPVALESIVVLGLLVSSRVPVSVKSEPFLA